MVYLAKYDDNGNVIGFIGEDKRFYPLKHETHLKEIGTIKYKTQAEIDAELEVQRKADVTVKATSVIEALYSPLKQRKLMSIAIALQDKQLQGGTLTTKEEALIQNTRDANTWITSIRTIENTAIADGTLLDDILWDT